MPDASEPAAEEIIRYDKDVKTRIATITFDRPVFMQKVFFEIMKQFQGEYLGSMLSGVFESMGGTVRPDVGDELMLDDAVRQGLGDAVKDNDGKFPADWALSKKARKAKRKK